MTTIKRLSLILLILILLLPVPLLIYVHVVHRQLIADLPEMSLKRPTRVLDRKGRLVTRFFRESQKVVTYEDIPEPVIVAFLTAEDRNFFYHRGIDPGGILRALVYDVARGSFDQGGSTITQQLVKQTFTTRERTLERKALELIVAPLLERKLGKKVILEQYLNRVYFGHGVYGVAEAASFYFGKELKTISGIEAALLATIPPAPTHYSPLRHPHLARYRHRKLLRNIHGPAFIALEERFLRFWKEFETGMRLRSPTETVRHHQDGQAPFFTDFIRQWAIEKFGEQKVYNGGLTIHTTLDLDYQVSAREAIKKGIERHDADVRRSNTYRLSRIECSLQGQPCKGSTEHLRALREYLTEDTALASLLFGCPLLGSKTEDFQYRYRKAVLGARLNGALIALDNETGGILAMVGGRNFETLNQLNRAIQSRRQPGSAFKTFLYGAAIKEKVITAATPFSDLPLAFHQQKEDDWEPANYDRSYRGRILARDAFRFSLNVVPVEIYKRTGGKSIARFASLCTGASMGRFTLDPTLALGSSELSPLEMARGYATIARQGKSLQPHAIIRVDDLSGRAIYNPGRAGGKQVIPPEAAYVLRTLLVDVVERGTARGATGGSRGLGVPAAGKTGTTTKYRDAWFAGFTPSVTAVVWFGCDLPVYSLGRGKSGSVVAAPAWATFIRGVVSHEKQRSFSKKPEGVVTLKVCRHSGKLPSGECSVTTEHFIQGTEPVALCDGNHDLYQGIRPPEGDEEEDGILEKMMDTPPSTGLSSGNE